MRRARILLSLIVSLGLDAWAVIGLSQGGDPVRALGVHGLACGFTALGFVPWFPESYRRSRWLMTGLVLGFSLPAPMLGTLFLVGFRLLFRLEVKVSGERNYVFGERQVLTEIRVREPGSEPMRSVLDVLSGRDDQLRRRAILSLRSVDPKRALPVLQKAIQDGDDQVRLLAQTQFNRILAGLETTAKMLEADLVQDPARPLFRMVQLAEQYHELVYLGLASEETQPIYLGRAVELLREVESRAPTDLAPRVLLLKVLVRLGRTNDARLLLEILRKEGVAEETLSSWDAELSFQERDWGRLAGVVASMRLSPHTDRRLRSQMDFWLGYPAAVSGGGDR